MIFFVFGCLLLFYQHYRKNIKYFTEGYRNKFLSLVSVNIDSGIAPLFSACIHAFFIENLLILTVLLSLMEVAWLSLRVVFFQRKIYLYRERAKIHMINNLLRILFLVTLLIYSEGGDYGTINNIHCFFMVSSLSLWAL
jgi:hypothetical protein